MSIRKILSLKRAHLQSQMDGLAAREAQLMQSIRRLSAQPHGLNQDEEGCFQIASMAMTRARSARAHLEQQCDALKDQRTALAREKLALDIADKKFADDDRKQARLAASRAADRL